MLYIILFLIELLILFFLSRRVHNKLSYFLFNITKSKKSTIYILAVFFFPGTLLHEMAHFLSALFLLVPVGNMELLPKIEEDSVKLGSVSIARTDPIRRFLISSAPFFLGATTIVLVLYYIFSNYLDDPLLLSITTYFIFTVANTMFMSKKDFEGVWGFLIIVLIALIIVILTGVSVNFSIKDSSSIVPVFQRGSVFLLVPLVLDIITVALIKYK